MKSVKQGRERLYHHLLIAYYTVSQQYGFISTLATVYAYSLCGVGYVRIKLKLLTKPYQRQALVPEIYELISVGVGDNIFSRA